MSWIRTRTGRRFFPLEPKMADIHIEDIAHALSNQCRFSGHTCEFYSVGQHSVHVADILKGMDFGLEVQLAGLLHDATEAYLVDLPTPLKRAMPIYQEAEERLAAVIRQKFDIDEYAEVVKKADMMAFATEVRDLMGNPQDWESTKGIDTVIWEISPWSPETTKRRFLDRYRQLVTLMRPETLGDTMEWQTGDLNDRYIAFEGIDGCGKSTQVEMFAEHLRKMGENVLVTREPGSPHIGLKVREFLLGHEKVDGHALELLFQADRAEHTAWVKRKLEEGFWVISDRSYISGLAYALSWGHNLAKLRGVLEYSIKIYPGVVIYLAMSPEEASLRVQEKGSNTREEARGREVMDQINFNFQDLLFNELNPFKQRVIGIPASGDRREVHCRVWTTVFPPNGTPC